MSACSATKSDGLTPKQERYCQLRATGVTVTAAAEQVGVSRQTASGWGALPTVQQRIDYLQASITADALRYLKAHAMSAAQRLVELTQASRTSSTGAINLAACRDILDRVGLKPTDKQQITISSEEIEAAARRLVEQTGIDHERAVQDIRARLRLVS